MPKVMSPNLLEENSDKPEILFAHEMLSSITDGHQEFHSLCPAGSIVLCSVLSIITLHISSFFILFGLVSFLNPFVKKWELKMRIMS